MSRPVRVEFPGACYHVMSHGVNDAPTFLDDLDHRTFLDSLKEFVAIGELIVFVFILMRTHFHLLLQTPMAGLSRHMRRLLGRYTGWFNRRHHRHGHLWQARYKAVVVQDGPETRVLNALSAPSFDAIRSAVIQTFPGLSELRAEWL